MPQSYEGKRYFKNPYPDYSDELFILDSTDCVKIQCNNHKIKKAFYEEIYNYIVENGKTLVENIRLDWATDETIYTGRAGQIMSLAKIGELLRIFDPNNNEVYLSDEIDIIVSQYDGSNSTNEKSFTFLLGSSGPLALMSCLYKKRNSKDNSKKCAQKVIDLYEKNVNIFASNSTPDEILYGRSGYLYSLLFLKRNTDFEIQILPQICSLIIDSGERDSLFCNKKRFLNYIWHGKPYLGAAHGYCGILYMLLDPFVRNLPIIKDHFDDIISTIDNIFLNIFPSGNLPSSLSSKNDELVQWCHGSPGAIYIALRLYKVNSYYHVLITSQERYYELAVKMANDIWERGLLLKGIGLCHGLSGNAYSFLAIYNTKKELRYLYYALIFAKLIVQKEITHLSADMPFSLFEGIAGALYFLVDLYNPSAALFPGFQTCNE